MIALHACIQLHPQAVTPEETRGVQQRMQLLADDSMQAESVCDWVQQPAQAMVSLQARACACICTRDIN